MRQADSADVLSMVARLAGTLRAAVVFERAVMLQGLTLAPRYPHIEKHGLTEPQTS